MEYRHIETGFILRLETGEKVMESLLEIAREQKIPAGFIYGIGALKDPELGYYDFGEKKYVRKTVSGYFELLSLKGNLSYVNGEPFFHVHVVLAGSDFKTLGGHLFEAEVSATLEGHLVMGTDMIERRYDDRLQLNLLELL